MVGENQRANDNDRYVLAAQPGQVAGAANRANPALEAHRPNRPARLRSPKRAPVPASADRTVSAGQQPSEPDFHAPSTERVAKRTWTGRSFITSPGVLRPVRKESISPSEALSSLG
jgi:hypothetical protein